MPVTRSLAQRGRARGRVMARCAEEVNVYGRRPEMLSVMIIINNEVRNRGSPGIDLVEENLEEDTMGSVRVKMRAFCRLAAGHKLGWNRIMAAKGSLQNKVVEILEMGLMAGSKDVKRSGVMLGSTGKKFCF